MSNDILLTVGDVSQIVKVSERTIWKWVKSGDLPSVRLGRLVRVRPQDLDVFVEARTTAGA